jgi:hypothetical protein
MTDTTPLLEREQLIAVERKKRSTLLSVCPFILGQCLSVFGPAMPHGPLVLEAMTLFFLMVPFRQRILRAIGLLWVSGHTDLWRLFLDRAP